MWAWGPMMGYGYGGGWMMLVSAVWWLLLLALGAALVWRLVGGGPLRRRWRRRGLDVLDERYARGEIERDEYLQKRRDLAAPGPQVSK